MPDKPRGNPNAPLILTVQADHGGIAAGRDIVNSPITNYIGLDQEAVGQAINEAQRPVTEQLAELTAQIAREKGVEAAPLRAVLEKLGEIGVPDSKIPARLEAAADQLIELRTQLARLSRDRPELAAIREQALALIDRGDLDGARAVLHRGREAARGLREEASRNEAEFLADEARIDHLQLAYRSAAAKYAEAAALVAPFDHDNEWRLLMQQANSLDVCGRDFGDNDALVEAIATYKGSLTLAPRENAPLQWARNQNNLGNALATLGGRERGTSWLEEAIGAYRQALLEYTRERVPLDWAMVQNNLGNVLQTLGERESGTTRIEEAVTAYRLALLEYTRERVPLQWAITQNNLGYALWTLGERETGTVKLEEAIGAYRQALLEWTRERVPLEWALGQNNLGMALQALAERKSDTAQLREAIDAYRQALLERTRERVPLDRAMTQNNLGTALLTLAEGESGTAQLEGAIAAFGQALLEWTRERVPLDWAMVQNNLGNALQILGERESSTARLEEAIEAYSQALLEWTRDRLPLQWAVGIGNQGEALQRLAKRRNDITLAQQALSQITAAFETFRDASHEPYMIYFDAQLAKARALIEELCTE